MNQTDQIYQVVSQYHDEYDSSSTSFLFPFRFQTEIKMFFSVVEVPSVICLLLFFKLRSRIVFLFFVLVLILFRPLNFFLKILCCVCFLSNGSQYHIGSKRELGSNFYIAHKFKSIKFNIYWLNVLATPFCILMFTICVFFLFGFRIPCQYFFLIIFFCFVFYYAKELKKILYKNAYVLLEFQSIVLLNL